MTEGAAYCSMVQGFNPRAQFPRWVQVNKQEFSELSEVNAIWERVCRAVFDQEGLRSVKLTVEGSEGDQISFQLRRGQYLLVVKKITLIEAELFLADFERESSVTMNIDYPGAENTVNPGAENTDNPEADINLDPINRISQVDSLTISRFSDAAVNQLSIGLIKKVTLTNNTLSCQGVKSLFSKVLFSDNIESIEFNFSHSTKELRECLLHTGSIKNVAVRYRREFNLSEFFKVDTPFTFHSLEIKCPSILGSFSTEMIRHTQPFLKTIEIVPSGRPQAYLKFQRDSCVVLDHIPEDLTGLHRVKSLIIRGKFDTSN